ncbi:Dimer Tnp hAT domain-containing protein [Aphis craccivora]|uniref:Dimer Tnp hAT domain-containing protein n=1 Tax=Aphis craccivora TaxID=307492 RepID=A0A6G0X4S8_APHCR|nr:Dimer Tnp hAT domain-containing protein [Aphis craccivora]
MTSTMGVKEHKSLYIPLFEKLTQCILLNILFLYFFDFRSNGTIYSPDDNCLTLPQQSTLTIFTNKPPPEVRRQEVYFNLDCERVFSTVNQVKTKFRNRLTADTISGVLYVKQIIKSGPGCFKKTCVDFEPTKAIRVNSKVRLVYIKRKYSN